MTPESDRFLQKAEKHLERGHTMLGVGLDEDAGRTAYLAAFHAAQALIFERAGKVHKTHKGVQTEFLRLTRDNSGFPSGQRIFLSQAYNLKAIADYETGPGSEVSAEKATIAVEGVRQFVGVIRQALTSPQS